jgi:hypothetical protein
MVLAGTRGIANAAVAEAMIATAIKPAWINRFIGNLLRRGARRLAQVPGEYFVPCRCATARKSQKNRSILRSKLQLPLFPESSFGGRNFLGCCRLPTSNRIIGSAIEDIHMKNSLLGSVAALTLIIGAGSAFAQGTGMKGGEAPAAAPKTESAAPASKAEGTASPKAEGAAPMNSPAKGSAETAPPAGAKTGATAQDKGEPKGSKAANDMKADTKPAATATSPSTPGNSKDAKNPTADSKAPGSEAKTTGNAATSATAAPPAEKRTQITSAIKQEKVEEVTNVNFNISIGTAVPSSVRYHPLPPRIVEIYPEWRGYDFIVVRGKYIILRPQTHEIVYIIEG